MDRPPKRSWSPTERDLLVTLWKKGTPWRAIARRLGRSVPCCEGCARSLGLGPRGKHEPRVPHWLDPTIIKLYHAGLRCAQIAETIKRPAHAVHNRIAWLRRKEDLPMGQPAPKDSRARPCLRCGREFRSAGIHNRLCQSCGEFASSFSAWMAAYPG